MKTYEKIEQLVNTRINGNSIKGNKTYENMLKSVKVVDIVNYGLDMGVNINYEPSYKPSKLYLINYIKDILTGDFL